jgi:hypothetical protein
MVRSRPGRRARSAGRSSGRSRDSWRGSRRASTDCVAPATFRYQGLRAPIVARFDAAPNSTARGYARRWRSPATPQDPRLSLLRRSLLEETPPPPWPLVALGFSRGFHASVTSAGCHAV